MNKIYVYAIKTGDEEYLDVALAEDGHILAFHTSSSIEWAKHDMGLTSDWKHDKYNEYYPEGFELEWIDEDKLDTHEGFQVAFKKNRELKDA